MTIAEMLSSKEGTVCNVIYADGDRLLLCTEVYPKKGKPTVKNVCELHVHPTMKKNFTKASGQPVKLLA